MKRLRVELVTSSDLGHMQQLYTGFAELVRAGRIELTWRYPDRKTEPDPGRFRAIAILDGGRRLAYDVGDSRRIDPALLSRVDAYYKRSCGDSYPELADDEAAKIRPLGLNYEVYPDHINIQGALHAGRRRQGFGRAAAVLKQMKMSPRFVPRQASFEPTTRDRTEPLVVFLTRAWDPQGPPARKSAKIREREALNESRAACIAALRSHFADRAIAGFAHSGFASRHYPTLLIDNPRLTQKANYQMIIRDASVCVTTAGLHNSVGWKMGEYVALGKAIVCEPLTCRLPGAFEAGRNFLPFSSPQECVAEVEKLLAAPERMASMMAANRAYYQTYLRPDRLIENTLLNHAYEQPIAVGYGK